MQNNPFSPFFSRNILPDDGEVGNAFWAHHISNNFSRLLSLQGTVYFGSLNSGGDRTGPQCGTAYIPVGMCGFSSPPIVQLAAWQSNPEALSRAEATYQSAGLGLASDIRVLDETFSAGGWGDSAKPSNMHFVLNESSVFTFGAEELFYATPVSWTEFPNYNSYGDTYHQYEFRFDVRGAFMTRRPFQSGENPYIDDMWIEYAAFTPLWTVSRPLIVTTGAVSRYAINPYYVSAKYNGDMVIINWYHDGAGTVAYQIFGA
jgi:hypothetical protein